MLFLLAPVVAMVEASCLDFSVRIFIFAANILAVYVAVMEVSHLL